MQYVAGIMYISSFLYNFKYFNFMGRFVIGHECVTVFMVCIATALSLKLQSENAGTYVHFVFIYKSPCKIFHYWPIFKIESSPDNQETGLPNSGTIFIYRDIWDVDIDIRKV